ncbi:MAG: PilZ domain-containing protein [Treponema sp.]|nr:PilZ domain-containing protein [Treponema sp.]
MIYSSSFQGAKIIANIKSGLIEKLKDVNNSISLRLSFMSSETENPVTFFVSAHTIGFSPYGGSEDVALFTLEYNQRPPDDLIEIMGRFLDANVNSSRRKDERILITSDSIRRLNLLSKECTVFIQGVPRRCILRDISFSGAKLIMMGVAKFLLNREAGMRFDFDDPKKSFLVKGRFIRAENVEGRKELVALVIEFDEDSIPMGYKIRINDYLSSVRVDIHPEDASGV